VPLTWLSMAELLIRNVSYKMCLVLLSFYICFPCRLSADLEILEVWEIFSNFISSGDLCLKIQQKQHPVIIVIEKQLAHRIACFLIAGIISVIAINYFLSEKCYLSFIL